MLLLVSCGFLAHDCLADELAEQFQTPPDSARPGVYWYFMDGNLDREAMTADLESMKEAGIGNLVFLEVNVGVPRGPVDFLSDSWQELFAHAVVEAERLGIEITLGVGPGWTGSGGPWVEAKNSMQHLVASRVQIKGPTQFESELPLPLPRKPFFGTVTAELEARRQAYYEDVAVLAFRSPADPCLVEEIDEKALVYRAPFSSAAGVKPRIPSRADYPQLPIAAVIDQDSLVDLTDRLGRNGRLVWQVPEGNWTVMRFCARNNGANTRPAPTPGYGFECDKFNSAAMRDHLHNYTEKLLQKVGPRRKGAGWTMLHMDSWEMGSQNWTPKMREQFRRRRGYDPLPFYPAYAGLVVESLEMTERFLWDLRLTGQELVLEQHAGFLKDYAHQYGLGLSIEPYDMNPTADLDLGAVADVPMCEFWSQDMGFNTTYSVHEASSIAHTLGRSVVAAEAFTADASELWRQYPGAMKNQGDWAFCAGVNRLVYHTFAHKPLGEEYRPGMTMGPYGVHWDRGQTWWSMVAPYHRYVSRCQLMLRQGHAIADILYLTPEGAPHVFQPPKTAMTGSEFLPDKRGFSFDGCSPNILIRNASVDQGRIVFPGGASYAVLVVAQTETMTPELLAKIEALVRDGATMIGTPPVKSPSLTNYPQCDQMVRTQAELLWGGLEPPAKSTRRKYGDGFVCWGGDFLAAPHELYPNYAATEALLTRMGHVRDFDSDGPIRYVHRQVGDRHIFFVSNRSSEGASVIGSFRAVGKPHRWDPVTGNICGLPEFRSDEGRTVIPLRFASHGSYFVVFQDKNDEAVSSADAATPGNFPDLMAVDELAGPWQVSFDPQWGGPERIEFPGLMDWTAHTDKGIKYYSGTATYVLTFDCEAVSSSPNSRTFLDLGAVHNLARVRLNDADLGTVWTAPWRVDATGALRARGNRLEIEVANLWVNRLIGDQQPENRHLRQAQWKSGLLAGQTFPMGRYTFATHNRFQADSPLLPSGLLGPVTIQIEKTPGSE
jgi:hypothetical protein